MHCAADPVQDLPSIVSTPDGAREEQVTTVDKYA